ncbi:unnamed protein product [Phytophthora lilii]|uniref:Unnamed protein product n=1 Tax=Phytophthora lilii TaxID=2077276 RepID=A0A9W6TQ21_9STRA|nr:unnamed protein product [Phytophthora lilii]
MLNANSRRRISPHSLASTCEIESTPAPASLATDSNGAVECTIGIDFGLLYFVELRLIGGSPTHCKWDVGLKALNRAKAGHPYTVYDLTLLLGRKVEALSPQDVARWTFNIRAGVAGKAGVECPGKLNSPDLMYTEQIAAMLLTTIKHRAENLTGKRVTRAVLSVPAAYNRTQRQALRDACHIAGIRVERLVISSTASAAYNAGSFADTSDSRSDVSEKTVMVVDCGGGSLSLSLARVTLNCSADKFSAGTEIQIEATIGDMETSGEALTDRLFKHFFSEARSADSTQKTASLPFARRLRRACVLAQKILSRSDQVTIDLPPWQPRRGTSNFIARKWGSSWVYQQHNEISCGDLRNGAGS